MNTEDLVLIQDRLDVQRMVVVWPRVHGDVQAEESDPTDSDYLPTVWARLSGVAIEVVRELEPMLRTSGICCDDGTVEPRALALIRGQLGERLAKIEEKRRKGR